MGFTDERNETDAFGAFHLDAMLAANVAKNKSLFTNLQPPRNFLELANIQLPSAIPATALGRGMHVG